MAHYRHRSILRVPPGCAPRSSKVWSSSRPGIRNLTSRPTSTRPSRSSTAASRRALDADQHQPADQPQGGDGGGTVHQDGHVTDIGSTIQLFGKLRRRYPAAGVWRYPVAVVRGCPIAHLLGDYSVLGV